MSTDLGSSTNHRFESEGKNVGPAKSFPWPGFVLVVVALTAVFSAAAWSAQRVLADGSVAAAGAGELVIGAFTVAVMLTLLGMLVARLRRDRRR